MKSLLRLATVLTFSLSPIPGIVAVADEPAPFGKEQNGEAALMGIFYDLTQTSDGKPSGIGTGNYPQVLADFIKHDWDENDLDRFYRASKPLFATQIWIPALRTTEGPKAFGVEKKAPHAVWVIHYKGQIVPPEDGTYRFVGFGDDVLIVGINEKIVLISDFGQSYFGIPEGTPAGGLLRAGTWFEAKKSAPLDIDVLSCDNGDPSGYCAAFVLIEQKGKTYAMSGGNPVLPIFQVAPYNTPDLPAGTYYPIKFSKESMPWTALQ